ncbi:MAG: glycosyltransferase [Rickettsiaceae bacterium]|nr:MAG: glycosyltransferase [Rickettsiaceae bacterium]
MSLKKIILVADVRDWAFSNIAQYLISILKDKYDCYVFYTSDYKNYQEFFENILSHEHIDFIHFFYRVYLDELLEMIANNIGSIENNNLQKFLNISITTSIPDHLFIDNINEITNKISLFSFVDNYYTVSDRLNKIYRDIAYYPKPWGTIYDNILIKDQSPVIKNHDKELVITWIGNSKWAEWHNNCDDYKGLNTIVLPIFVGLIKENITVKENILDSQRQKRSREEILKQLLDTDILLICAKGEGTPLPVIEAMASGCAILSTDCGIFPAIGPHIQQEFILESNSRAFVAAIKKLDLDRSLLTELKRQNLLTYQKIFNDDQSFVKLWSQLIEDSIAKLYNKNRLVEKLKCIDSIKKEQKNIISQVKHKVKNNAILKIIIITLLKIKAIKSIAKMVFLMLNYFSKDQFNIDHVLSLIKNYDISDHNSSEEDRNTLTIYSAMYPGVSNSTTILFNNTLPIRLTKWHYILGISNKDNLRIARAILKSSINKLIFSGGDETQIRLAKKIYDNKQNKKIDLYLLWHGSPAQWVDNHHRLTFHKWLELYQQQKIKLFITLKKDLEQVLSAYDIKSQLLQNFISDKYQQLVKKTKSENFCIGMWSASDIWVKNPYPQLLALGMLKTNINCYTNFQIHNKDKWIIENCNIKVFNKHLPHEQLIKLIADTSLTLYVTNTECSPMIALESLSLGVPCLVGPTSDLYQQDKYLAEMLTVNRVDCPHTILIAIEKIILNYDEIKSHISSFVIEYNQNAMNLKRLLIQKMNT